VKRVFLAAALAFALHGLLFWISPVLLGKKNVHKTQKRTVTLNLTTRKTPAPTPKPPSPVPTAAMDETASKVQKLLKKHEVKQKTVKNPPPIPEVEKVPTPEKTIPQTVKKKTPPIPEKKKTTPKKKLPPISEKKELTPKKKIAPPPKKITKPEKKPAKKKEDVKVVQPQKPLPPKPAKKAPETKSKTLEKTKRDPSRSKNIETSNRQAAQSVNQNSRTPVTAPSPSSNPDIKEIQKTIPGYKNNPAPAYPRKARRRGYKGTVVLNVLVSEKGAVMGVRLSKSSGHKILDRAAETAVREWIFEPGTVGTKKVEMWVNVPVRFDLKSR